MSEFIKVAEKSDIPVGQGRPFDIQDRCVAIFNCDGEFYAIDNICPHRQGSLGEGALFGDVVSCPFHGWEFNVKTGNCEMIPGESVERFDLKVEGEYLLVKL